MPQELLMQCKYGWGKVFRLYRNRVEVNEKTYPLTDLLTIEPTYYRFMGVSSARLRLRFTTQTVVVNGIAEVEDVRQAVIFLHMQITQPQRLLARQTWLEDYALQSTSPVEVPQMPHLRQERSDTRLRRQHDNRQARIHGFDVEQLTNLLKEDLLPVVPVPLCLHVDEYAHYNTYATLGQETLHPHLQPSDHGMLILTNKRMIYMGRISQLVLHYAHVLRISRLEQAVAILATNWSRRELFEVKQPLECTMYFEAILERFRDLKSTAHSEYVNDGFLI